MSRILTHSGVTIDIDCPDVELMDIGDIAWGLSRQARFGGHTMTSTPYSVAQHSIVMSCRPNSVKVQQYALMHDAHEAYIGDIQRPVKRRLRGCGELQANFDHAIFTRFGLKWPMSLDVHGSVIELDNKILATEMRDLMPESDLTAEDVKWAWTDYHFTDIYTPHKAYQMFLSRFRELFTDE